MVTTIQVKETTKQLLDRVKSEEQQETYDDLIKTLLIKRLNVPELFGMTKKQPLHFKKEDEMEFNEV